MTRRRLTNLGRCLRNEGGFALPTVLLGTVATLGLGAAMVTASLNATSGATRDADTKSAFAVAEAGVSNAIFRYNRFDTFANSTTPCLAEGAGGQVVAEPVQGPTDPQPGWCGEVSMAAAGGQVRYYVRPNYPEAEDLTIVSVGTSDGISRRVQIVADHDEIPGNGGVTPFGEFQLIGKDSITVANGSTITANVGTQGTLTVTNGGKLNCDEAQATQTSFHGSQPCPIGVPDFDLPPVNYELAKNDNDNALLSTAGCHSWSPTTKQLMIPNSCTLTIGTAGETTDFYLCKLTLASVKANSGGELIVRPGATVNFWFAPPQECAGNTVPYEGGPGSKITAPGEPPSTVAFLVAGSTTIPTSMTLSSGGNCANHWPSATDTFVVYAPETNVNVETGPHVCGAIAAKTLTTQTGSSITKGNLAGDWELPGSTGGPVPHFVSSQFRECPVAGATAADPAAGC